jgi:hypothetical protein
VNGGFSDENASWLKPAKAGQPKHKSVQQHRGKGVPSAKGGKPQQQQGGQKLSGKRKAPEPESEEVEDEEEEVDTGGGRDTAVAYAHVHSELGPVSSGNL